MTIGHCINEKLYKVTSPSESTDITTTSKPTPSLWHERYGHLNQGDINKMLKCNIVEGMEVSNNKIQEGEKCHSCSYGKMHRLPFPKQSSHRASKCLEIVHTDLCGPMQVETASGSKYMLTFIDDFSRFTVVYFLTRKSEVLEKFQEFANVYEKSFANKIQELSVLTIRSDNGGEYKSDKFTEYCRSKGINRQFTNPDTPQQNGVSERYNRTIMEGVRSMIYHANLPLSFWAEAANTMVYLRNRSPTAALQNVTPYELWHGEKPDVSNLRVFGCVCFVNIPKAKKLERQSFKGVFVGYPEGTKGYKIYNVSSESFVRSRDVEFYEHEFHDFEVSDNENSLNLLMSPFEEEESVQTNTNSGQNDNSGRVTDSRNDNDNQDGAEQVVLDDGVDSHPGGAVNVTPPVIPPNPIIQAEVCPTYEETFMRQVSSIGPCRTRKQRLVEEAQMSESCCLASLIVGKEEPKSYKEALV